jgi:type II secretion system protein C
MFRAKATRKAAVQDSRRTKNYKTKRPWFLVFINFSLVLMLVYLGRQTLEYVRLARMEPEGSEVTTMSPADPRLEATAAIPPLANYRHIWERNLFQVSNERPPAPEKEISPEPLAPAPKDIGLKLVGTVVADTAELSRAFIDNRKTQSQKAYFEGDKAGDVVIKKVLRNKVIVGTDQGDRLLTVGLEQSGQGSITPLAVQPAFSFPDDADAPPTHTSTVSRARTRSISVDREDVESTLANTEKIMEELEISPYTIADRPYGFRLGNIEPDSVLIKMGLRNGMVITEVNGEKITRPDQAARFFQTLKEGGDIAIKYRNRRRTMQLNLSIG